jgi:phage shock protein PspC (stress-responsive transcriptional regulator)/ribosomal protein L40E
MEPPDKLVLLRDKRKVSGVCAGIARRFGLPIWLVRTVFVVPGAFWLVGPIAYLLLAVSLEEWPPSAKGLINTGDEGRSLDVERLARNDRVWNRFGKFYLIGLAACLIAIPVTADAGADAVAQFLLCLFFIGLIALIPFAVFASIAGYRANKAKILRARQLDFEKHSNRICIRCHESLPPTASVCSSCGCEDLQVATR